MTVRLVEARKDAGPQSRAVGFSPLQLLLPVDRL
jgi:hypothetical protein